MSRFLRLLSSPLLVVALAAASALFVSYRRGSIAHQSVLEVATTGDLRDLFGSRAASGSTLVDIALRQLESDFYKPIDPQTPLAGESARLRTLPERERRSQPRRCRARRRTAIRGKTVERAGNLLAFAQQHYAADVGPSGREDLTDAALRGIMNSVHDPYTVYLSPREISGAERIALGRQLRRHRRLHLSAQRRPDRLAADRDAAGRARRNETRRNRRHGRRQAGPRCAASTASRS